jgi:hypothetical protein
MKKLYGIQVLLGFLLYLIGFICQEEQERLVRIFSEEGYEAGPYGQPSMLFATIGGAYCVYCLFMALKTAQRLRKMGAVWSVASLGMGIFSVAMYLSPRGISLGESLWAWTIYIVLGCGWAVIVYQRIDAAPLPQLIYEDEILDDL